MPARRFSHTRTQQQGRGANDVASIDRLAAAQGMSGRRRQEEEDEFWQIALAAKDDFQRGSCAGGGGSLSIDDDDEENTDEDDSDHDAADLVPTIVVTAGARSYRVPVTGEAFPSGVTLRLSGLSTGVASPLGAQAWYGSALLVAALVDPRSDGVREALAGAGTALELGSGAVGLSGLALACVLAQSKDRHSTLRGRSHDVRAGLFLTDYDEQVLSQLQANVSRATRQLSQEHPGVLLPDIGVCRLDWNDSGAIPPDVRDADVRLVVGSELVYTPHNAEACAGTVLALLGANPRAIAVVVQVTDREGWNTVFLPTLLESNDLLVKTEPIDPSWHELASSMIPLGGTTDRFDFGVCYVSRAT